MIRDMDLIRELLLRLEALSTKPGALYVLTGREEELTVEGFSEAQIEYHLNLLRDAGYIESPGSQPMEGVTFTSLTWHGHDFLDSVRNPETWSRTKEGALKIGGWTVDMLLDIAKAYARHLAREKLGLDL